MNEFLKASTKKDTFTENFAVSNSSTGNLLVDDFSKAGTYRARPFEMVTAICAQLWATEPMIFLQVILYLRMITRKIKGLYKTENVQRGQGAKDEPLKRLLWLAYYHPVTFYKNLWLVPLAGSWKDLWTLMVMDIQTTNEQLLNHKAFFELMLRGLNDESMKDLVIKYMPQIKAKNKCTTERAKILNLLAKKFAGFMDMSYAEYRKFKAGGLAHKWQQQISKGYYDQINFSNIPGKALASLVDGKFLKSHNLLAKYEQWLDTQPVVKFNGYAYELLKRISNSPVKNKTIDKQFEMLIQTAKQGTGGIKGNVWVAVDSSGSMGFFSSKIPNTDIYAIDIAKSLAVYFSAMNEGAFKDNIIMFDNTSRKLVLSGTFTEKVRQIHDNAMGSTNFQSVIDEIVRVRIQNPNIPIADYPETLLVISDLQFNATTSMETNYEAAMRKLEQVGLPRITIIWWQVTGRTKDFPSTIDDKGTIMLSGFDGAIISLVLGGNVAERQSITLESAMQAALDQELMKLIQL